MAKQITKKEEDYLRLLASQVQIGTKNLNFAMKRYIDHKTTDGVYILKIEETWQKIKLAARAIVTLDNPEDVIVVSARPFGQRAAIKFATYTKAICPSSSRWTPGTFTNQNTKKFLEPRLLIVTDPKVDKQAIIEASYVNIPVIALCDSDSPLDYVDIAIPCNNRSTESISMIYWMLAREILILRGLLNKDADWDVLVDLFYYKSVDELENQIEEEDFEKEAVKKEQEEKEEYQEEAGENQDNADWE